MLAGAHTVGQTTYASDGENVLAKVPVNHLSTPSEGGVDVLFAHEGGDKGRGWVYHATQLSAKGDQLSWQSDPDVPVTPPDSATDDSQIAVADYWKDFSPSTSDSEAPMASEEDIEDAYWASYGATASGAATPGPVRPMSGAVSRDPLDRQAMGGKEARVMCDMPSAPNGTAGLDPLAALLSTLPDRLAAANDEDEPSAPPRELVDYRDKVRGRILASLREAWAEYSRDVEARHEDLEEKAHAWLRIGRSVEDGKDTVLSDTSEVVARAKLQVLKDLYTTATADTASSSHTADQDDSFWRHIESAIKMPMHPGLSAEAMGMTQETYWE